MALRLELESETVTASPIPVVEGVRTSLITDFANFSAAGKHLVYERGAALARVARVDREGNSRALFEESDNYRYPALSPDGRRLAVTLRRSSGYEVWIYELDRGTRIRLSEPGSHYFPAWSPDGDRVSFTSLTDILSAAADGSGEPEPLVRADRPLAPSWHPDGTKLAFLGIDRVTGVYDIYVWEDGLTAPLLARPYDDSVPRFSPDGRWLAFMSNESGVNEIYMQAYPGPGERFTLSTEGGTEPIWSRDGTELFYRNGDKMMVVTFETEPTLRPVSTELLFEAEFARNPGGGANYDVSPDGSHFYMIETEEGARNEILVVLNWTEELKRLVPLDD